MQMSAEKRLADEVEQKQGRRKMESCQMVVDRHIPRAKQKAE